MSGFPSLSDDGDSLEGLDAFPLWPGAPRQAIVSIGLSEGRTLREPGPEQASAYASLRANEVAVRDAALEALLAYARGLDPAFDVPRDLAPEAFRSMVELQSVNVLPVVRDGLAYVGLGFWCAWDEEHGAGVMTHAGRVVEAGGADVSFLEWVATEDGGAWPS